MQDKEKCPGFLANAIIVYYKVKEKGKRKERKKRETESAEPLFGNKGSLLAVFAVGTLKPGAEQANLREPQRPSELWVQPAAPPTLSSTAPGKLLGVRSMEEGPQGTQTRPWVGRARGLRKGFRAPSRA